MARPEITKNILIEELVNNYPFSVRYLMEKGIRCIMCGEPIWGTLEEAAQEKGFSDADIDEFVKEMRRLAENNDEPVSGKKIDEPVSGKKIDVKKME